MRFNNIGMHYFSERCAGGPKSKDFWPTVKPFLSNKGLLKDPVIILSENDNIISNQISVASTLNEFFLKNGGKIGGCRGLKLVVYNI